MSYNIKLEAELKGTFTSEDGKVKFPYVSRKSFVCYQTPTKVTKKILNSSNPAEAYKECVMDLPEKYQGIVNEYSLLIAISQEHIEELDRFLKDYEDYNILWYGM